MIIAADLREFGSVVPSPMLLKQLGSEFIGLWHGVEAANC